MLFHLKYKYSGELKPVNFFEQLEARGRKLNEIQNKSLDSIIIIDNNHI